MARGGKRRQRGLERGIDRVAIALPRLDHAQAGKLPGLQKFSGDRHATAPGGIVLDDDDRETAIGALTGEQFQRQPQMLRTAKAGNADHDPDRTIERRRRRRQRAGDGGHHLRGWHRLGILSVPEILVITLLVFAPGMRSFSHVSARDHPTISRHKPVSSLVGRRAVRRWCSNRAGCSRAAAAGDCKTCRKCGHSGQSGCAGIARLAASPRLGKFSSVRSCIPALARGFNIARPSLQYPVHAGRCGDGMHRQWLPRTN